MEPTAQPADPLQRLKDRDAAADAFERAWRSGNRPDLRAYVGELTSPFQREMLRILLPLDWDYRRDAGELPSVSDYQALWPAERDFISKVISEAALDSQNPFESTKA